MTWLKQSTAVTVPVGPFVDSTDGVTAETALTISQADIRLSKNGGAYAQTNNATGASHMENGWYGVPLDTTDTNTLGSLVVAVNESGACPAWRNFMVVPANVWDSLFGADKLQVHADEITAGLITAAAIATDAIDADAIAANAVTEIQNGLATASALATVDGIVDDILVDTGTTIPAQIAALNNLSAADILTTALTEAYAADGVAPTLTEILFLIQQHLSESSISGTTKTVKKLDGSTTAATFTLNDATTPTAITRAS